MNYKHSHEPYKNAGKINEHLPLEQSYIERDLDFKDSGSTGVLREIKFDSIHIKRISMDVTQKIKIPFMTTEDKVILFFSLLGCSELNTDYIKNLNLKPSTHNIFYTAPTIGQISCDIGRYEVFYIGMSRELFKEYFPKDEKFFERFNQQMSQSKFSILRDKHGLLSHRMINVIEDICQFDNQQFIKKIFIKAKVIELLSLQLNELCMVCNTVPAVRTENAEKMYKVQRFIIENLGETHTLTDLAHLVGTNEYTLKKEFKELFGTTVFGFWADVKMENAQRLLTETRMDIKEISEISGYKNPQHFSTAFKRKFGITPSQFRRNREQN